MYGSSELALRVRDEASGGRFADTAEASGDLSRFPFIRQMLQAHICEEELRTHIRSGAKCCPPYERGGDHCQLDASFLQPGGMQGGRGK